MFVLPSVENWKWAQTLQWFTEAISVANHEVGEMVFVWLLIGNEMLQKRSQWQMIRESFHLYPCVHSQRVVLLVSVDRPVAEIHWECEILYNYGFADLKCKANSFDMKLDYKMHLLFDPNQVKSTGKQGMQWKCTIAHQLHGCVLCDWGQCWLSDYLGNASVPRDPPALTVHFTGHSVK